MTLDDILHKFESPREAAAVSDMSRTAAYHWYASGSKRVIPPAHVIIKFVDHFGFDDGILGLIIRDCERVRGRKMMRKRKKKAKIQLLEPVDWDAKERFLKENDEEKQQNENIFNRLTDIIQEHL